MLIIMQKVAETVQVKSVDPKELMRAVSEDALAYYNKIAGTGHVAPEIVLFSNLKEVPRIDKSVLKDMDKVGAGGTYAFGKIYVDDRELWLEPTQNKIEVTTRSISHEFVHYARDKNGAGNRHFARLFSRKIGTAIRTLEEGCAVFVSGVYCSEDRADVTKMIRTVYSDIETGSFSLLPKIYDVISSNVDDAVPFFSSEGVDYHTVSKMSNMSNACPTYQEHVFYIVGTNLATIIYAANDLNVQKTAKKLLTLNYDELLQELKYSVRPCTEEAICHICDCMRKDSVQNS